MDCLKCTTASCQTDRRDCTGNRETVLDLYRADGNPDLYEQADRLVSEGRAGTLSRAEEILHFCRDRGIGTVSLAYCYALDREAAAFAAYLREGGVRVSSYRCTINGIAENEVHEALGNGVNCNPVGQALAVNEDDSELVVEFGLCLGHDILFHQYITKPFTVFAVKDRVHAHNPLAFLQARQGNGEPVEPDKQDDQ
ncbi:DUF1847 domain-containing protein [bacterium]|nr:DUF1847 domain-containing protein [bacterium]